MERTPPQHLFFSDGTPKEGIDTQELIQRIGQMSLIYKAAAREPFDIDDEEYTTLHSSWRDSKISWTRIHDQALLKGVVK